MEKKLGYGEGVESNLETVGRKVGTADRKGRQHSFLERRKGSLDEDTEYRLCNIC
jgi:hypothetical protein